ncbi:hypothetical protein [Burkholderia singularis]|uniref:hypothetical protein n=1 Tax=Burkholderia singularis TaxID=1503053 RepID=UPI00117EAB5B|nr:hypothetical protein [Burkholderia singularis]
MLTDDQRRIILHTGQRISRGADALKAGLSGATGSRGLELPLKTSRRTRNDRNFMSERARPCLISPARLVDTLPWWRLENGK